MEISIAYRAYLERRRLDISQVLEAVFCYLPPDAIDENYLVETLSTEFNDLSDQLEMPDLMAMMDRWIAASEMRGGK